MKRLALVLLLLAAPAEARTLKVCADPNNLPFSNRASEGFENKLAAMIAADLHAKLDYVWWAQRRGYVRNTLGESKCDFWPGIASNVEMVATTRPYYRSTYMFVSRADGNLKGLTLDDPRLKRLRIGVQMVGNDASNTPPAHALAERGVVANVRGYMLYGDYRRPNPPAAIAVWLMVLYSDGGRLRPFPSHRPSGIWRAISQCVIVAVIESSGYRSAASAS